MKLKLQCNKDPLKAHFINKQFYLNDQLFKKSINKIFKRNPIYLGHNSLFDSQFNFHPISIYPNLLDEEIILNIDKGELKKILSNVCTHRAHLLLNNKCSIKDILCPYHGRRFNCNGDILNAPGFENQFDEIKQNENLSSLPFINLFNFYFLTNELTNISNLLGEFHNKMDWFPFSKLFPDNNFDKEFEIDAHWALYVENYLEGFHIPFIHKGLSKEIRLSDYKVEILPKGIIQTAFGKSDENTFKDFDKVPEKFKDLAAIYLWIYPNVMINIYPWGVSINVIIPQAKEKTIIRYETYSLNPAEKKTGAGGDLGTVEMEDQHAILKVQRGLKSTSYQPGKISSIHELGVHHFHKLIINDLNN